MFFFWNRTRREIALSPFGVFSSVKTCFCPYLDHRLFDFLASLPPQMLLDKRFHSDTIRAAHPRVSAIPYAVPQRPRASTLLDNSVFSARVGWYGLQTNPGRIGQMARLAAHLLHAAFSPAYRKSHASIGPAHLLYFFQLDDTIRQLAGQG